MVDETFFFGKLLSSFMIQHDLDESSGCAKDLLHGRWLNLIQSSYVRD